MLIMDKIRIFRTYHNGMNLVAMVSKSMGGWCLDVQYVDCDGNRHPHFDHSYKDERGAIRAMNTRFRGAEWEETT